MNPGQQNFIYQQLAPVFAGLADRKRRAAGKAAKQAAPQEMLEIWMAVANLERLPVQAKAELGKMLLQKFEKGGWKPQELWALSRLGARIPFYGPVDRVLPAKDAIAWVKTLMTLMPRPTPDAAQALVNLGRTSGDRARDLPHDELQRIAAWLAPLPQAGRYAKLLTSAGSELDQGERDWIFGESLPLGLRIASP